MHVLMDLIFFLFCSVVGKSEIECECTSCRTVQSCAGPLTVTATTVLGTEVQLPLPPPPHHHHRIEAHQISPEPERRHLHYLYTRREVADVVPRCTHVPLFSL